MALVSLEFLYFLNTYLKDGTFVHQEYSKRISLQDPTGSIGFVLYAPKDLKFFPDVKEGDVLAIRNVQVWQSSFSGRFLCSIQAVALIRGPACHSFPLIPPAPIQLRKQQTKLQRSDRS